MKLDTAYNLNQKVWTMDANHAVCFEIKCIQVVASNFEDIRSLNIVYSGDRTETVHNERDCYLTKEELLASL